MPLRCNKENYAAIAQQVERILGKDEVPSSNLGSSSKEKPRNLNDSGVFLFRQMVSKHPKFAQILGGIMGGVKALWGA